MVSSAFPEQLLTDPPALSVLSKYPMCQALGGCAHRESNAQVLCFHVRQALLPRTASPTVMSQEEHTMGLKKAAPLLFSPLALCNLPHSIAEQLAQQIALGMEMYMYKISPKFFYFA